MRIFIELTRIPAQRLTQLMKWHSGDGNAFNITNEGSRVTEWKYATS